MGGIGSSGVPSDCKPRQIDAMPIRVSLHGRFRIAASSDEIEVPDTTRNIGDLLEELTHRLGPDLRGHMFEAGSNELSPRLIVLVNGHSIKMLEGLKTPLAGRDTVTIDSVDVMEVVGGG